MGFLPSLLLFLGRPKSMSATLCRRCRFPRRFSAHDGDPHTLVPRFAPGGTAIRPYSGAVEQCLRLSINSKLVFWERCSGPGNERFSYNRHANPTGLVVVTRSRGRPPNNEADSRFGSRRLADNGPLHWPELGGESLRKVTGRDDLVRASLCRLLVDNCLR